jgi:hypothetical protein
MTDKGSQLRVSPKNPQKRENGEIFLGRHALEVCVFISDMVDLPPALHPGSLPIFTNGS